MEQPTFEWHLYDPHSLSYELSVALWAASPPARAAGAGCRTSAAGVRWGQETRGHWYTAQRLAARGRL